MVNLKEVAGNAGEGTDLMASKMDEVADNVVLIYLQKELAGNSNDFKGFVNVTIVSRIEVNVSD